MAASRSPGASRETCRAPPHAIEARTPPVDRLDDRERAGPACARSQGTHDAEPGHRGVAGQPAQLSFDEGLTLESQLSAESLETTESRALRHVFFAERDCGRAPVANGAPVRGVDVNRAAVVGAGTMGSGIAMALADAGIHVALIERDRAALDRGLNIIRDNYASAVQRGRIDEAAARGRQALIEGSLTLEAARDADLVIEAVFEDLELKRSVLKQIDSMTRPEAIVASNTSSLSVTSLAAATQISGSSRRIAFLQPRQCHAPAGDRAWRTYVGSHRRDRPGAGEEAAQGGRSGRRWIRIRRQSHDARWVFPGSGADAAARRDAGAHRLRDGEFRFRHGPQPRE